MLLYGWPDPVAEVRLLTADEDKPKPITIMIGPTIIGGNILFNHLVPTSLINKPTTQ